MGGTFNENKLQTLYAYSDFIYRFVEAINFITPSKKIRVKPTQNLGLITKLCQQCKDGINSI